MVIYLEPVAGMRRGLVTVGLRAVGVIPGLSGDTTAITFTSGFYPAENIAISHQGYKPSGTRLYSHDGVDEARSSVGSGPGSKACTLDVAPLTRVN